MFIPRRVVISIACAMALAVTSCASAPQQAQQKPGDDTAVSDQQAQDAAALALFQQAYETLGKGNRAEAVPEMERLYREIIDRYPRAALAQEAYWRLILICLRDYSPPAFDKAEELHMRFLALHPDSHFRAEIDNTLTESYGKNKQWERMLRMYTPAVRKYIETGKLAQARDMFMYAEAKYGLNDLVEAEKGYKIVIALFPRTRESSLAAERIKEIKGKKLK